MCSASTIKTALVAIGGEWSGSKGSDYQLDLQPVTDADGWVRHVLKQGPGAPRLIVAASPSRSQGSFGGKDTGSMMRCGYLIEERHSCSAYGAGNTLGLTAMFYWSST